MRLVPGLLAIALLSSACSREEAPPVPDATEDLPLAVYAAMPRARVQSVLDAYTAETGKEVQLHSAVRELSLGHDNVVGSLPGADLFLLPSLTELWYLAESDEFRPTFSDVLESHIPSDLRDPESRWTTLATSARFVVYNSELVRADELGDVNDYAALGEERWHGKLCLSSSTVSGNLTLVAFLIRKYDLREAEIAVRRWRANLATSVFSVDADLIDAISTGQCAIGIAGSNALAVHIEANAGSPVAFHEFADPAEVVVDASGGGVSRHAHNPEDAADLLVWLTMNAPNALYAAQSHEFPANDASSAIPGIDPWRRTVSNPTPLSDLAFLHDEAVLLVQRAKYP